MRLINLFSILLFTCVLSFFGNFAFSQISAKSVPNWTILEERKDFKIEMKTQLCETKDDDMDKTVLLLRFTNLKKTELNLSWEFDYYFDNKCLNCDRESIEYQSTLKLQPLEILEGNCLDQEKALRHFVKFENIETRVLTDFKIKNLQVLNTNLNINK